MFEWRVSLANLFELRSFLIVVINVNDTVLIKIPKDQIPATEAVVYNCLS